MSLPCRSKLQNGGLGNKFGGSSAPLPPVEPPPPGGSSESSAASSSTRSSSASVSTSALPQPSSADEPAMAIKNDASPSVDMLSLLSKPRELPVAHQHESCLEGARVVARRARAA